MEYAFDRFLRYDELVRWMSDTATAHPNLVSLDTYGRSHEGRELWLMTITDAATGPHHSKPAHWIDASIHAVELTATVAACAVVDRLVRGHDADERITHALRTRTFYIVPRVNPDGAEWALADRPVFRRSSTRPWPWTDGHRWPGLHEEDVDGDGRVLQMRIPDPAGAWMPHPDDRRLLIPIPAEGAPPGVATYRLLDEGSIVDHDGFTIPTPPPAEGLDLNRNFPAGWGRAIPGAGDHPLSEPEIDALVRAIVARPNVCGLNAFHTSGGVLLRPSSTQPDAKLPPMDVWVWKQLAERGTQLTGYPAHSVYEDFTWDPAETMSGAADDWAYEHTGVFGWTTEFWDIVHAATGTKQSTHFWYTGPTDDEALAVLRWCDEHHPDGYVDWYPFEHPSLGDVELGGWDSLTTWVNPPAHLLRNEVEQHADFAVHQALCSPALEIPHCTAERLSEDTWRVEAGIANTGWLPTDVSAQARRAKLVKPLVAEIGGVPDGASDAATGDVDVDGAEAFEAGSPGLEPLAVVDGPARRQLGQLEGRASLRFSRGHDGTPDRALARWIVRARPGDEVQVVARHDRAGEATARCTLH
ncbi:MAG: M14 family metallopeptidase [Ilumatobacter sp.]|uniref:M14 family metallopeptidase n=1 Tax=Ilumatobacter sp. TaxID=1967498 RepID=UPI00263507E2|nr:M14 family metallopeptidase [Ilumatobacter sp.]MDJ0769517.1 M14 family metallopeptidase [Ilumatobacter sp.]